jgi:hypothetical protein
MNKMFDTEQSWKMTEPEKVLAIVREVGVWRLGNWDGCVCSSFSIRNVDVDISCGKGRDQGVWISSPSYEYNDREQLRPIAVEIVRQLDEQANRAAPFKWYFGPWKLKGEKP